MESFVHWNGKYLLIEFETKWEMLSRIKKSVMARQDVISKVIIINEHQEKLYTYSKGMEEDTGNNQSNQFQMSSPTSYSYIIMRR